MVNWRAILAFALGLALVRPGACGGPERACWVWNRAAPLTPAEQSALAAAGITRLYWQAGELELRGHELALRRTATLEAAKGIEIIPVVRVSTSIRSPEQFSGAALGAALKPLGPEAQVDFDCPDRLLAVYADRLRAARTIAGVHRLTITALAEWADTSDREALWHAVDAVYPMLYDTETDAAGLPLQPRTLLDAAKLGAQLRSWSRCPIPWYAGLPVFARVTLFDAAGRSAGHLRTWDWEDIVFNPALALDRPPANGATILRAARPTRVGHSAAPAGSYVVIRAAEPAAVRAAITQAEAAGARGTVFFRLPDPSGSQGSSLPQLLGMLNPSPAAPRFSLSYANDRWTLRNASAADLPPRFAPERAYALEMEIAGEMRGWREALAGEFHRVDAHAFANDKPVLAPIPLAQRLTFWFADLPAKASLTTGLVQLAPGIDLKSVRYRLSADEPWQTPE